MGKNSIAKSGKTKIVSLHFNSLEQAEKYQDKLYEKYDSVLLKYYPIWGEAGMYIWHVK